MTRGIRRGDQELVGMGTGWEEGRMAPWTGQNCLPGVDSPVGKRGMGNRGMVNRWMVH